MTTLALQSVSAVAPSSAGAAEYTVDRILWNSSVVESSGLARSTYERTYLWTHNDSGDSPRIFAFRKDGSTKAVMQVSGAYARDWEDIAAGPNHTLWIGDIGDNGRTRDHITVYKVIEPEYVTSGGLAATRYDFRYPDGARDAEALMVRPSDGRLFVVTKSSSGGGIYRAPSYLSRSSTNTLTRVASAPATVTGASFAPDSESFVLCTYTRAYVYAHFGDTPTQVSKVNNDKQGESIEVNRNGTAMYIGQEGSQSPVYSMPYPAP